METKSSIHSQEIRSYLTAILMSDLLAHIFCADINIYYEFIRVVYEEYLGEKVQWVCRLQHCH